MANRKQYDYYVTIRYYEPDGEEELQRSLAVRAGNSITLLRNLGDKLKSSKTMNVGQLTRIGISRNPIPVSPKERAAFFKEIRENQPKKDTWIYVDDQFTKE